MSNDFTPTASLTDEELLHAAYHRKEELSPLELDLLVRLEHALDVCRKAHPAEPTLDEIVERGAREAALVRLTKESQDLGLYNLPLDLE